MVIIKNLKKIPEDIKYLGYGKSGCKCPCYERADMSGPECCTILAISKGSFDASPFRNKCPLKEVSQN